MHARMPVPAHCSNSFCDSYSVCMATNFAVVAVRCSRAACLNSHASHINKCFHISASHAPGCGCACRRADPLHSWRCCQTAGKRRSSCTGRRLSRQSSVQMLQTRASGEEKLKGGCGQVWGTPFSPTGICVLASQLSLSMHANHHVCSIPHACYSSLQRPCVTQREAMIYNGGRLRHCILFGFWLYTNDLAHPAYASIM